MILFNDSNTVMAWSKQKTFGGSSAYVRLSRGVSPRAPAFARWKNMHRQSIPSKLKETLKRQMEDVKNGFLKQKMEDKRYKNEKRRQEKILNFVRRNPALIESIRLGFMW